MTSNNSSCFTPLDDSTGGSSAISEQDYIIDSSSTTKNKEAQEDPLLSILNVVVDHVMMPPTPMEPMEFREVCRMEQKLKEKKQHIQEDDDVGNNNNLFQLQAPDTKDRSSSNEQNIHGDINDGNSSKKDESILLTGLPLLTDYSDIALLDMVKDFQLWKKVRMIGSAAMAAAYIASAKADMYKEQGSFLWDIAAGAAIVNAAGGSAKITNQKENYQVDVAFSNKELIS